MRLNTPHVLRRMANPHFWNLITVVGGVIITNMEAGRRLGIGITGVRFRTRVKNCAIALTLVNIFVARIVRLRFR